MTVEIRGTTTTNKGAQLMLEAIVERLKDKFDLSASPALLDYSVRAQLGMYQTLHINRFPKVSASLGGYLPREIRRRYGLTADQEIQGVVDASGFAYSDVFGHKRSQREAAYGERWHRRGVPKVMLPQAYGPFENAKVALWTTRVLNQAEIVFVRDNASRQYLERLQIDTPITLAPDFTIGLSPLNLTPLMEGDYAALVPNTKLVTKGILPEARYIAHLVALARAAISYGLEPLVVVHESSDRQLSSIIARQLGARTFEDPRPRALKAAIGGASLLIASRFHAIVGGLSQSVPTIAIGWSHKYGELLDDFGVREWIDDLSVDPDKFVARVLNDDSGALRLRDAKEELLVRVEAMWQIVEDALSLRLEGPKARPIGGQY